MTLKDLIDKQEKLQLFLKHGDFSFIAPVQSDLFDAFLEKASRIAPGSLFNNSIQRVLSNRQATIQALNAFAPVTEFQIYIVPKVVNETKGNLTTITLADYCNQYQIDLSEISN
jgi:hypothetical protein